MKKVFYLITLTLLIILILAACGGSNETAETAGDGSGDDPSENADSEVVLKVGIQVGDWSALYAGVPVFVEQVEEMLDGTVQLDVYPDAQLGGEREMMESIQAGNLEMGFISSTVYANFDERLSVFDLPFLVSSFEDARKMNEGPIGDKVNEILLDKGMRNLAWGHGDLRRINQNVKPVHVPSDMEGLTMRVPESTISTQWYESLGVSPVPLPNQEIYTALQQGVVDGQDNGAELTLAQQFSEHHEYSTITHHVYYNIGTLINEEVWQSLSTEVQDGLQTAAEVAMDVQMDTVVNAIPEYTETMIDDGIEIIELTPEERQEWVEHSEPIWGDAKEIIGEELYNLAVEHRDSNE